jgi:four helix bundle protein
MEITKNVYRLTRGFPKEEMFVLTIQMRRSAISIPGNMAERFKRYHGKEFRQFLRVALGSGAEHESQMLIRSELDMSMIRSWSSFVII